MERSFQIRVFLDVQDIVFQVPLDVQDAYQSCLQFSAARELYRPRELQALKHYNNETSSGFLSQVHTDVQKHISRQLVQGSFGPSSIKAAYIFFRQPEGRIDPEGYKLWNDINIEKSSGFLSQVLADIQNLLVDVLFKVIWEV